MPDTKKQLTREDLIRLGLWNPEVDDARIAAPVADSNTESTIHKIWKRSLATNPSDHPDAGDGSPVGWLPALALAAKGAVTNNPSLGSALGEKLSHRKNLGTPVRLASGALATMGGWPGAAFSGGGEALAEDLESDNPFKPNLNIPRITAEGAIGAVPFGKVVKAGAGAVKNAARMGLYMEAGNMLRRGFQGENPLPTDTPNAVGDAVTTGLGAITGGVLGKFGSHAVGGPEVVPVKAAEAAAPAITNPTQEEKLEQLVNEWVTKNNVDPKKALRLNKNAPLRNTTYGEAAGEGHPVTGVDWDSVSDAAPGQPRPLATGRGLRIGVPKGEKVIPVNAGENAGVGAKTSVYRNPATRGKIPNVPMSDVNPINIGAHSAEEGAVAPGVRAKQDLVQQHPSALRPDQIEAAGIGREQWVKPGSPVSAEQRLVLDTALNEAQEKATKIGELQVAHSRGLGRLEKQALNKELAADMQFGKQQATGAAKDVEQHAKNLNARDKYLEVTDKADEKAAQEAAAQDEINRLLESGDLEKRTTISGTSTKVPTETGTQQIRDVYVPKKSEEELAAEEEKALEKAIKKAKSRENTGSNDPTNISQTSYPSEMEAYKAIARSGKRGTAKKIGKGNWMVRFEGEPEAAKGAVPVTPEEAKTIAPELVEPPVEPPPNTEPPAPPPTEPPPTAPKPKGKGPKGPKPSPLGQAPASNTPALPTNEVKGEAGVAPVGAPTTIEKGRIVTAGLSKDGKVIMIAHASEGDAMNHYNGMKASGDQYPRLGNAKLKTTQNVKDLVARTAKQFGVAPEDVNFIDRANPVVPEVAAPAPKIEPPVEAPKPVVPVAKPEASTTPSVTNQHVIDEVNKWTLPELKHALTSAPLFRDTPEIRAAIDARITLLEGKATPVLGNKEGGNIAVQEPPTPLPAPKLVKNPAELPKAKLPMSGDIVEKTYPKGAKVTVYDSEGDVLTHGPMGVRIRFTSGKMMHQQPHGFVDIDPNYIEKVTIPETPKVVPEAPKPVAKAIEGPDRQPTAPIEEPKVVEPEGEVEGRVVARSSVDKDSVAEARATLEKRGYTNLKETPLEYGRVKIEGVPPKAKFGSLEESSNIDLDKVKNAKGVKARVVEGLKNLLGKSTRLADVTEENGTISVNGDTVAHLSKGYKSGGGKKYELTFDEDVSAAAGKAELPTLSHDELSKSEATQEAIEKVRGWWLKRNGAPLTEVKLPNGFSIKIHKDTDTIQAAINKFAKGDESAWSGIVDKAVPAENPTELKWPWGKPGSKSKYTAEEVSSGAFQNQMDVIGKLQQFTNKVLASTKEEVAAMEPLTVKLANGFEMTIEPRQAPVALEHLENQPLHFWEDTTPRTGKVHIDTPHGTSFKAKENGDAPGYDIPLPAPKKGLVVAPPTGKKSLTTKGMMSKERLGIVPEKAPEAPVAVPEVKATPAPTSAPVEAPKAPRAPVEVPESPVNPSNAPTMKRVNDIIQEEKANWDKYHDLKAQLGTKHPDVRALGKRGGELRAELAQAIADREAAGHDMTPFKQPTKAAAPAGKGPTSDDLKNMAPEQQEAELKKVVDEFKSKGKRLPKDAGQVGAMLAVRLGLGATGAVAGAAMTPDDPLTGALLGGGAGLLAPTLFKVVANHVRTGNISANANRQSQEAMGKYLADKISTIEKVIPDVRRFNLLSNITGLVANGWVGPWGSAILGAFEHHMAGDIRGTNALRELGNPFHFAGEHWNSYNEAKALIDKSSGRAEMSGILAGPIGKTMQIPADIMTAGDVAARKILMRHGFSELEARKMTLTSEPTSAFFKGEGNARKSKGDSGAVSFMWNMLMPFYRTNANQVEQSLIRLPIIGAIARNKMKLAPISPSLFRSQQQISTGVLGLSGVLGYYTPETHQKNALKFLSNFAGVYGTTATMGFVAGASLRKGGTPPQMVWESIKHLATSDIGLPTIGNEVRDVGQMIKAGTDEDPNTSPLEHLPSGAVPPILSSKRAVSIPTVTRMVKAAVTGEPISKAATPTRKEYSIFAAVPDNPKLVKQPVEKTSYQRQVEAYKKRIATMRKIMKNE